MPAPLRAMPGPASLPVFGAVLNYSRFGKYSFDRLHLAKQELYKLYGKIYKEKLGPATIVQLFDPTDIATVFRNEGRHPNRPAFPLTQMACKRDKIPLGMGSLNGEDWYKLRQSVQKPMMRPLAAAAYLPAQNQVADDFLDLLRERLRKYGEITDLYHQITKYTMESIGTVCFNTRIGCLEKDIKVDSEAAGMMASSAAMFDALQRTNFAFPWFLFYRTQLYKQFVDGKLGCNRLALTYIENAMAKLSGCPVSGHGNTDDSPNFLSTLLQVPSLATDDVVDLTTELFVAGIDSTTNALCFALYNLARNPDKQAILRAELNAVLQAGQAVTPDIIDRLKYLKACVKESFRLNFPVEGGTTRILERELVLSDFSVPKGTFVAMNNQTMCMQDEYFDNPQNFIPERWLKDKSATLRSAPPYVMMPFGYGPRMCIGRRFAEQEIYLALIKIIQSFVLEYHHEEEIGMLNRIFTMPDKPLRLQMAPV